MPKDILLYGYIWEYSALYFHEQIKEALAEDPESELTLRVNTEGGSPDYMQSIMAKVQSLGEAITVIGESRMHSAGFFLMCYVPKEQISATDVTQGVLHRASYSTWIEDSSDFKDSISEDVLKRVNKNLEAAVRARVDVEALEALPQMKAKNFTLKDIFDLTKYNEVILSAKDMKKIGLIGKIIKITPEKLATSEAVKKEMSKCRTLDEFKLAAATKPSPAAGKEDDDDEQTQTENIMDLNELKTKFPAIYAQAKAEGHADGIAAEKDRVEGIMVFASIDPEICKTAIESGKPLSQKQLAELHLKSFSANTLEAVKKDSTGKVITEAVVTDANAKDAEKEKFAAEVRAKMGIKPKEKAAA